MSFHKLLRRSRGANYRLVERPAVEGGRRHQPHDTEHFVGHHRQRAVLGLNQSSFEGDLQRQNVVILECFMSVRRNIDLARLSATNNSSCDGASSVGLCSAFGLRDAVYDDMGQYETRDTCSQCRPLSEYKCKTMLATDAQRRNLA